MRLPMLTLVLLAFSCDQSNPRLSDGEEPVADLEKFIPTQEIVDGTCPKIDISKASERTNYAHWITEPRRYFYAVTLNGRGTKAACPLAPYLSFSCPSFDPNDGDCVDFTRCCDLVVPTARP